MPVRKLMALTACCPNCAASFRDLGLSMRHTADESATFFDAIQILMCVEERLGIEISDETVEAIRPWSDLTLHDLATAVQRADTSQTFFQTEQVVLSAVKAEFPSAPELLDFSLPLLDAISPHRYEQHNN